MKTVLLILSLVLASALTFISCSKSDTSSGGNAGGSAGFSCSGISPTFAADIQPILTSVCSINSNCHGGGSINSGGPLTTYNEVFFLRAKIRAVILARTMPQSGTISQAQINSFICWIDAGAMNN
jgi:hypothetical protein